MIRKITPDARAASDRAVTRKEQIKYDSRRLDIDSLLQVIRAIPWYSAVAIFRELRASGNSLSRPTFIENDADGESIPELSPRKITRIRGIRRRSTATDRGQKSDNIRHPVPASMAAEVSLGIWNCSNA